MNHHTNYFSAFLIALLLFHFTSITHLKAQIDRESGPSISTRSEIIAQRGMVATSQPLATQIGLQILKNGGNAIDAAIAANAAIGLMEPTGNGIGGDLFAIIWHQETNKLYALNASGRTPLGLGYDDLIKILDSKEETRIPPYDLLSISVPGAVDGWFSMHEKFGLLPFNEILEEPIWYAENGFPVSEAISNSWYSSARRLKNQPGAFLETFTINGEGPKKGQIFKNKDLANTFRLLAREGKDAFYKGEIATKIDTWMKENGGYLRYEDFVNHESEWVTPQTVNYRGYDVFQVGGNVQGTAVLQMLNILEGFNLKELGFSSAETLHLLIETKKIVFEDRAKHYADPAFYDVPYEKLLSKEYGKIRRALISDTARFDISTGVDVLEDGDTIYLTTADQYGNMVSLIQSNFRGMGTGFVVPGTGFSFQNRGELFSLDPMHPNVYEPGKRPFHTIIPGFIMKDGKPFMTLGNMGGAYQPLGHVSLITNIIDFGMNLQESGDALRWNHTGSTQPTDNLNSNPISVGIVGIETSIDPSVLRKLEEMGHKIIVGNGFFGRFQAIMKDSDTGVYYGASESRVDGQAAGY
jgi:gamma-glutamyltranspeptidase/glutathione hydrolase